jgi:hypothetical protein
MHGIGFIEEFDVGALRELRKMDDKELLSFGKAAREVFAVQLKRAKNSGCVRRGQCEEFQPNGGARV